MEAQDFKEIFAYNKGDATAQELFERGVGS